MELIPSSSSVSQNIFRGWKIMRAIFGTVKISLSLKSFKTSSFSMKSFYKHQFAFSPWGIRAWRGATLIKRTKCLVCFTFLASALFHEPDFSSSPLTSSRFACWSNYCVAIFVIMPEKIFPLIYSKTSTVTNRKLFSSFWMPEKFAFCCLRMKIQQRERDAKIAI
jgi:hypothetical protein